MTEQTPQEPAGAPQSTPGDSMDAEGAAGAGERRTAGRDELREQIAAIFRVKDGKLPDWLRGAGTAEAVADAVLAVRDRELERLREQQAGFFAQMAAAREQARQWWQRAQAAERTIERVRQMATAWQEQLPDTIRTATAAEAILTATEQQETAQ